MKKNALKELKLKEKVIKSTEESEVKNLVIILISMVVVISTIFIFTKYVINDGDVRIPLLGQVIPGTYSDNLVTVGTMLNRVEDTYYVFAYSGEDMDSITYSTLVSDYSTEEDSDKIYFLNTDLSLNANYLATDDRPENTSAKTIDEISLGKVSLIQVKDGKINKYITDVEKIKEELK